ncbi:hypothetical protein QYE76_070263 [Lolium multiflorum]|uniref:Retrotransposon gag domain-containing protein n=1 Tax=Lolium multiflorum TaxID=4521 RepID=A0AAD8WDS1_LOLMU|nr:hypothetical protein QYE76_070263 [Lolium multiflorum]
MNEDATTQHQSYPWNGKEEGGYPTQVESDTNVGNIYGGATGEYTRWVDYDALNDQFVNTDFSLGSSSDSDYQPTGRPYVQVGYAATCCVDLPASWWDNIVPVYPAGRVFTWEEFARKFGESNVPEGIVELKRREFELEQKDKAILTYVGEFSKLSRYAVEEVNTEDKKKKRFLRGLSPQFKVQLRMMRATEFHELVDAAITLEDDFKHLQEEKRKKAKFEPRRFVSNKPNTSLSFKPRYNNTNNNNSNYYNSRRNQAFQTANQIVCRSCGDKRDGGRRMYGDYRNLNNVTIKNKYPLQEYKIYSIKLEVRDFFKIDLRSGYHEIKIKKEDVPTAFVSSKCEFWLDQVEFLGHVISKDGIAVNPSKVAAVLEWEAPKTVKEIRGFLGMAGYYRRFFEGFSKIAGPMTKQLRKNTPFVWSEECEKSFQTLKEKLTMT